ncbi:VCBS repeat-containing protein [Deinococcus aquaedulcis]|uniref:VCBS repeat-containing protein n=1 Tax=Deinococcus aquaedulcis TaxID=2840455 RepID=UPI001C8346F2|nr:VCBS repeat-containing protein [Deinococcus aquaedulcis]
MRPLLPLLLCGLAAAAPVPSVSPVLATLPGERTPYLLGAWAGGRWLNAAQARPQVRSGASYTRLGLGAAPQPVRGSGVRPLDVPCEQTLTVPVSPTPALPGGALFVGAAIRPQPRPVTLLPTANATYAALVRAELVRRGLTAPTVHLTRLVRTDLDGNGTQEVLIEASRFAGRSGDFPPPVGQRGDYSVLLLRHVVNGRAVTTVLGEHVAPLTPWDPGSDAPMPMATLYRLAGVADLNGDGRMELAVYGAYYEGAAVSVLEWSPAGVRQTPLESGCGV